MQGQGLDLIDPFESLPTQENLRFCDFHAIAAVVKHPLHNDRSVVHAASLLTPCSQPSAIRRGAHGHTGVNVGNHKSALVLHCALKTSNTEEEKLTHFSFLLWLNNLELWVDTIMKLVSGGLCISMH